MLNIGIVSNCWNFYLQNGVKLRELVAHAADLQMRDIEFRQGSLGDLEPSHTKTHLDAFQDIAQAHYHCCFDYAMSFPFFGGRFDSSACDIQLGREIASALGNGDAHLRLVDITSDSDTAEVNLDQTIRCLAVLADDLHNDGVRLSIEHSFQKWDLFFHAFMQSRERSNSRNLWLCFDPANFSLANEAERIAEVVALLDKSLVSMLHVKQANAGVIETELCKGEVNWPEVVRQFHGDAYAGPMMFEFISSPEVERVTIESMQKWHYWIAEALETN